MQKNEHQWDSELNIISSIQVIIPVKLYLICNQIAGKVGNNEFSIVTDIKEKDNQNILLTDEFYIPKQKVDPSNIDYLPDDYHHSVCIHRHPDGCNGFSSTDREYINQNFILSLLYTKRDGFINGIYNMRLDDKTLIQLPVEIIVDYNLEKLDLSNIEIEEDIFKKPASLNGKKKNKNEIENVDLPGDIDWLESRVDMLEEAMIYDRNRGFEFGNF